MAYVHPHMGLSYDDVLLVPQPSVLESRKDADISSELVKGIRLDVPVVSAPMSSVTEGKMARAMGEAGGLGVIHRFMSVEQQVLEFATGMPVADHPEYPFTPEAACAIGLKEPERLDRLYQMGCRIFVLDVAHADSQHVYREVERINSLPDRDDFYLVVGNIATGDAAQYLADLEVDAVKVGIGPGAACTTREVTGFGYPQLTAVMNVADALADSDVRIIADGGIKTSGDIVKALAAGAHTVMVGRLLAGCDEAPHPGEYFGMASSRVNGHKAPEGVEGQIDHSGPVAEVMKQLAWGIRSGVSYGGGADLAGLRENAEFIQVAHGVFIETSTRV